MNAVAYGSADKLPLAGGTLTGPLVLTGSPAAQIPSGAASGKVLTSDGAGNAAWDIRGTAWINVKSAGYGAKGDGVTNDTAAIQAAHTAARTFGLSLYFPGGTYLVTPASSTVAAVVWNNGTTGDKGIRWMGDTSQTTIIKRTAPGPIVSMSGPSTDVSGATHCRFCSLENLVLSGNNLTGTLIQTYYADDLLFRDCQFNNSADVVHDTAEFWDSRFFNCVWNSSGSTTGGTTAPNVWLRNTAATSGFGYSADTVNNIYFWGCRWEQPLTGAVRIERGVGANTGQPYSIYLTSSKFETAQVNGGPMVFVDTTARDIHILDAHAYAGGFYSGYSTPQDVFTFGPQFGSLRGILIFNATANAVIASGVTVNAPLAKARVVVDSVFGSYTGGATPTVAHINFGTNTGDFLVNNCQADNGTRFAGNVPGVATGTLLTGNTGGGLMSLTNLAAAAGNTAADLAIIEATAASQAFGVLVTGDTFHRLLITGGALIKFGPGNATWDANISRTGAGQLTAAANWVVSGTGSTTGIHSFSAGTKTAGGANVLTPSFANGTAAQLSDLTHDYMVYLTVGTAGTAMVIKIGPTSTPANTIVPSSPAASGQVYSFRVPAGWFVQWSATTATLAGQTAIGC